MTIRVNARLPADVARKVAYLQKSTRKTTTEIVRESIELYYDAMTRAAAPAAAAEALADFVGCADGPADLSRTYKARLVESLEKKA